MFAYNLTFLGSKVHFNSLVVARCINKQIGGWMDRYVARQIEKTEGQADVQGED